MSVLKQDHFAFDEYSVLDTIILGNPRLYEIIQQKEALYAKEDFSDEDGVLGLLSWRANSPSSTAGRSKPTPPACCRGSDWIPRCLRRR